MQDIRKVLVVGAGTMGEQIVEQILNSGFYVSLFDIYQDKSMNSAENIRKNISLEKYKKLVVLKKLEDIGTDIDLVIETITEDLNIKRKFYKQLNKICRRDVVFVTNTSDLIPSQMAKSTGRGELFCAYHFHAPKYGANVVDIMPHKGTSKETIKKLEKFTRDIKLIPLVIMKENQAYAYNAILNSIMGTSIKLVISGVAKYQDIDKAWMGNTGMKVGPFGMLDLIGIDTAMNVTKINAKKNPLKYFGYLYLKKFAKQGKLGIKTGEGFYKYPNPEYTKKDFLN